MREGAPEQSAEAADPTPRRWRHSLSWYALFLVGWLLYEYTSQPGLAAAVTCAKFGWADWRSAWWLRRVDPDERRGRTCFRFYLAYGLWKVALMASVVMFVLLVISSAVRRRPAGAPGGGMSPAVAGVLAAAGVGFGLSFFMTYLSLWSALRNRVKVWLGAAPHLARTRRYWPPSSGQHNAAPFVTVTTLVITLWFAVFGAAQAGMVLGPGPATLALLALLALASPLTVFVLKYLERRVFARRPEECWPPDELGVVCQADDPEAAVGG
jgi:hypothetical protein